MGDVIVISAAAWLAGEWPEGAFLIRTTDGHEVSRRGICRCGRAGYDRYSLGLPAGRYCGPCWDASGYRKEGREGFDPTYAGECYEEDDYY
jgi:hypothetical protein